MSSGFADLAAGGLHELGDVDVADAGADQEGEVDGGPGDLVADEVEGERLGEPSRDMVTMTWVLAAPVTLPNIRKLRGVGRKLDGRGSYNLGIGSACRFPEITMEAGRKNIGLDIAIVTTAHTDDEGRELLRQLGMPFRTASVPVVKKPDEGKLAAPAAEVAAPVTA